MLLFVKLLYKHRNLKFLNPPTFKFMNSARQNILAYIVFVFSFILYKYIHLCLMVTPESLLRVPF